MTAIIFCIKIINKYDNVYFVYLRTIYERRRYWYKTERKKGALDAKAKVNVDGSPEDLELLAEEELEELLERPENRFLLEHEMNRKVIEDYSRPAVERLKWARNKIKERLNATFILISTELQAEVLEGRFSSFKEIENLVSDIAQKGKEIGQGGDAVVLVIDSDTCIPTPKYSQLLTKL